uniref:Importin-9 n=1 Tax=Romanomermis culicivorax TaxID=13658 RepID=A0A915JWL9_ROMCU
MGTLSPSILNFCQEKPGEFDIDCFISTFVSKALQYTEHIILQGQALWFASRVCEKLSTDQIKGILELCSKGLLAEQHQLMKCIAVRSLYKKSAFWGLQTGSDFTHPNRSRPAFKKVLLLPRNCCDFIKSRPLTQIIEPFLKDVTGNLIALGLKGGETLLSLSLSTLSAISELSVPFDESTCSKMLSLSNAAVLKYSGVSNISSLTCPIFVCVPNYDCWLPISSVSLEVLEAMVQGTEPPLPDSLIKQAFPVVAQCVLTTDDTHTLQAGRECVRSFVSKSADQILGLTDNSGYVVGIGLLVQVICRFLEPSMPELSASMVGRLIFVVLRKADRALAPHLERILNAVLNKMQHTELPAVHQSLIMVFAHLIHYDLESVVKFLSLVVMPAGNLTALEFVFKIWCDKQRIFLGAYDQKVRTLIVNRKMMLLNKCTEKCGKNQRSRIRHENSNCHALALCKIMQYVLTKGDSILMKATVDEEFFLEKNGAGAGYSLRSRAQNKIVRKVPLVVKMFSLILAELGNLLESPEKNIHDNDSDTGTDTEDLNSSSRSSNLDRKDDLVNVLSSLVNDLEECSDDDDDELDDADIQSDPRSQINLKTELSAFLTEFVRQPFYQEFKEYLSPIDLDCLQRANLT